MERVDIAVVGAGLSGLTLALSLSKTGRSATLFESAPELSEIGAGVAIAGPAVRALADLGVDLASVGSQPPALEFRNWSDGRLLSAHDIGPRYLYHVGAPYIMLHRATLQQLLVKEARRHGVDIRLGYHLVALRQSASEVELSFANGESVRAKLVIGADGIHSVTRSCLFPNIRPVYSGEIGFRGLLPREKLPRELPDPDSLQIWLGPDTHAVLYGVDGGRFVNFLYVYRPKALPDWTKETNRVSGTRAEAFSIFEQLGWAPMILETISHLEGDLRFWALMDVPWTFRDWNVGSVILIGDAAHAPLPHQGMGAGLAIEDAYALGLLLGNARDRDLHSCLQWFVAFRYPRVAKVQRYSRIGGWSYKLSGESASLRDKTLWKIPERVSWIHIYDVHKELRKFFEGRVQLHAAD